MIELEGEQYLDGDEASAMLGVKLATLYAYVSRGILHSFKQGIKRQRLYKQAEIEALLRLRPGDAPSPTISSKNAKGEKDNRDEQADTKRELPALPRAEDWVPYT